MAERDPRKDPRPDDVLGGPVLKVKIVDITIGTNGTVVKLTAILGLRQKDEYWPSTRTFTLPQWGEFSGTAEVLHVAE